MPVEDGIGYGELTPLKIEHLSKIVGMHLAITQAVINKTPQFSQSYRFIDLTSGRGFTPNGLKGSPLVFLEQAESMGFQLPYRADFIERDSDNLDGLKMNIEKTLPQENQSSRDLNFFLGSYEKVLPEILKYQDSRELGLIFVDPTGELPDFEALKYVALQRPRMEILIYLSTTNIKRVHHLTEKTLSDYMTEIGKKHWLIRKPVPWDSHKWTFLLGSNTSIFKNYKSIEFLRLDSDEAQSFFPRLNLTERQRQQLIQPPLIPPDFT